MSRFCIFAVSGHAIASDNGSLAEAVALVRKAIAYMKESGKEKAFAEFSNPKGQFIDRDMYIFAFSTNGDDVALAHGGNARLFGRNLLDLHDVEGKYMAKEFLRVASEKSGSGYRTHVSANFSVRSRVDAVARACYLNVLSQLDVVRGG